MYLYSYCFLKWFQTFFGPVLPECWYITEGEIIYLSIFWMHFMLPAPAAPAVPAAAADQGGGKCLPCSPGGRSSHFMLIVKIISMLKTRQKADSPTEASKLLLLHLPPDPPLLLPVPPHSSPPSLPGSAVFARTLTCSSSCALELRCRLQFSNV